MTKVGLLTACEVTTLISESTLLAWMPGTESATAGANKACDQVVGAPLASVRAALLRSGAFRRETQLAAVGRMQLMRYRTGHFYGPHVDAAFIDGMRTDLAFTVCLVAPTAGGELRIPGCPPVALTPGDCVVYPANTVHEVTPVLSGERIVVVGWCQSRVEDPRRRTLLRDLEDATHRYGDTELRRIYNDLLRMWSHA